MRNANTYLSQCQSNKGFGLALKGSTAMAVLFLAIGGSFAPEMAQSGVTWGQGAIAAVGASIGAFLAMHR